jgi:hypothetical protein
MKKDVLKIVVAVLLCCGGLAQAVPITIQIAGNITSASGVSLPGTIHTGTTFIGTYTYDSATIASIVNGVGGHYVHNSPYGISLSLGGYDFETASNHVGQFDMWIANNQVDNGTNDHYTVFSDNIVSTLPTGFTIWYISWGLRDSTHDALSSNALPIAAPVLDDWNYNVLRIYAFDSLGYGISIYGTVTRATPEPLTGLLMITGMFFLRHKR